MLLCVLTNSSVVLSLIAFIRWLAGGCYLLLWLAGAVLIEEGAGGGGFAPAGIGIFSVVRGMLLSFAMIGRPELPDLVDVIRWLLSDQCS